MKIILVTLLISGINCSNLTDIGNREFVYPKFATPCTTPNGEIALCVEQHQCEWLRISNTKFIQESSCESSNAKFPKVCCGTYSTYKYLVPQPVAPQVTVTTTRRPFPKKPPPDNLDEILPKNCGIHKITQSMVFKNRIFGGEAAYLGEYPWMVQIWRTSKWGNNHFACTGFLIHKRYVLTAAHCVNSKALAVLGKLTYVVIGEHDTNTKIDCQENAFGVTNCAGEAIKISVGSPSVYTAYNENDENHKNDIALLPLQENVRFTDYIQPICIPDTETLNKTMWVSGWGKTETDNDSPTKLKVSVERFDFDKCKKKYAKLPLDIHRNYQICAGAEEGKDSCSGDSGGPLMVERDGRWYAEGIVSFGVSCGKKGWPAVYTNVPYYSQWIKKRIADKAVNRNSKRGGGE